jgi:endonuclease YncB( thermonuclease family)
MKGFPGFSPGNLFFGRIEWKHIVSKSDKTAPNFEPLILFLLIPLHALAWQGKAINISDGETITVLTTDKQQVRVQLYGIDAPEMGQDFRSECLETYSSGQIK